MSYSLKNDCGLCTKKNKCTDVHFLKGAVEGIHFVPIGPEGSHMGSGSITMKCDNFEGSEDGTGPE